MKKHLTFALVLAAAALSSAMPVSKKPATIHIQMKDLPFPSCMPWQPNPWGLPTCPPPLKTGRR
jgi:hypothetical protein